MNEKPTTSMTRQESILIYDQEYMVNSQEFSGFIYWICESRRLGFLDFNTQSVYEKELDKRSRQILMRNIADTLLEMKWTSTFKSKALKVGLVDQMNAELSYVTQKVVLPRVEANLIVKRQSDVFKTLIKEVQNLNEVIDQSRDKSSPIKRHVRMPATPNQDIMNKNRRLRTPSGSPFFSKLLKTEVTSEKASEDT